MMVNVNVIPPSRIIVIIAMIISVFYMISKFLNAHHICTAVLKGLVARTSTALTPHIFSYSYSA